MTFVSYFLFLLSMTSNSNKIFLQHFPNCTQPSFNNHIFEVTGSHDIEVIVKTFIFLLNFFFKSYIGSHNQLVIVIIFYNICKRARTHYVINTVN